MNSLYYQVCQPRQRRSALSSVFLCVSASQSRRICARCEESTVDPSWVTADEARLVGANKSRRNVGQSVATWPRDLFAQTNGVRGPCARTWEGFLCTGE